MHVLAHDRPVVGDKHQQHQQGRWLENRSSNNELADPAHYANPQLALTCELVRGKLEMHSSVAARIDKNGAQTFAPISYISR
jgi:hypothetical protein